MLMLRRSRVFILIVSTLLGAATAAHAEGDFAAALARARGEQKLVLLYLRAGCARCNGGADAFLNEANAHDLFAHLYQSFVMVRADTAPPPIIDQHPRMPAVLAVDPSGKIVLQWQRFDEAHLARFAATLIALRRETPAFVEAANLRLAGRAPDADFLMARALINLVMPNEARAVLDKLLPVFRATHDEARVQQVQTYLLYTMILDRHQLPSAQARTVDNLRRAADRAKDPAIAATAHLLAASALSLTSHSIGEIVEQYRRAYVLAPAGSPDERTARAQLAAFDPRPLPEKASRRGAGLTLQLPALSILAGRIDVVAAAPPNVTRVEFLVDGVIAARSVTTPHRATLDLGPIPVVHELRAVGYDRDDADVAEAVATINDRANVFRVRITAPAAGTTATNVEVQAVADVPPERTLRSLELYWKEQKLATLTQPPFHVPLTLPPGFGYVRAVGTLDDGTTAEDTRVLSGGIAETVDVQGVVFPATVMDRKGVRVPALKSADFHLQEDGQPVDAIVREAEDAPVTIGIAVDTSASMQPQILSLVETVTRLLAQAVSPQTTVFITGFDTTPYLIHPPSNDAASLRSKVFDLEPSGSTALYDGLVFALQQFQGVPGKKALIVLSDGIEVSSRNNASTCIRLARALAVPIYGFSPAMKRGGNAVVRLAEETGGLIFYAMPPDEQTKTFAAIADEVRGQYLISFVSRLHRKAGEWIKLRVSVEGASVRTVSGYFAK